MTMFIVTPKITKDYMVLWLFNIIIIFRFQSPLYETSLYGDTASISHITSIP